MATSANLTPNYSLAIAGRVVPGYTAFYTVILNLVVTCILTPIFNATRSAGTAISDRTSPSDYFA